MTDKVKQNCYNGAYFNVKSIQYLSAECWKLPIGFQIQANIHVFRKRSLSISFPSKNLQQQKNPSISHQRIVQEKKERKNIMDKVKVSIEGSTVSCRESLEVFLRYDAMILLWFIAAGNRQMKGRTADRLCYNSECEINCFGNSGEVLSQELNTITREMHNFISNTCCLLSVSNDGFHKLLLIAKQCETDNCNILVFHKNPELKAESDLWFLHFVITMLSVR